MRRFLIGLNMLAVAVGFVAVAANPPIGWAIFLPSALALWAVLNAGTRLDNHNREEYSQLND
jgi:hypothetical protein